MKPDNKPNDTLIEALLEETASEAFYESTLNQTLAYARRRQQSRKTLRTGIQCLSMVMVFGALFYATIRQAPNNPDATQTTSKTPEAPMPAMAASSMISGTQIKKITDEELFALLGERPIAVIHSDQTPSVIFLDEIRARRNLVPIQRNRQR